jgi:hypothetical protein
VEYAGEEWINGIVERWSDGIEDWSVGVME